MHRGIPGFSGLHHPDPGSDGAVRGDARGDSRGTERADTRRAGAGELLSGSGRAGRLSNRTAVLDVPAAPKASTGADPQGRTRTGVPTGCPGV